MTIYKCVLLLFYDRKSLSNYLQNWKREKLAHFWPSYLYIWLINRPIILALKQNITFYQEPDRTSRSMLHVASTNSKQFKTEGVGTITFSREGKRSWHWSILQRCSNLPYNVGPVGLRETAPWSRRRFGSSSKPNGHRMHLSQSWAKCIF